MELATLCLYYTTRASNCQTVLSIAEGRKRDKNMGKEQMAALFWLTIIIGAVLLLAAFGFVCFCITVHKIVANVFERKGKAQFIKKNCTSKEWTEKLKAVKKDYQDLCVQAKNKGLEKEKKEMNCRISGIEGELRALDCLFFYNHKICQMFVMTDFNLKYGIVGVVGIG